MAKCKVQKVTLQGANVPWQKQRVFTLTSVFLLQVQTKCRQNYCRQSTVQLQESALLFKSTNNGIHFRLLSAKADSHLLTKDKKQSRCSPLFQVIAIKEESRANFAILFAFLSSFHTLLLSHQSVL